jgi:alkylation response protein AidB-like acyl-CoA dehydrogenase
VSKTPTAGTTEAADTSDVESVDTFRLRARAWIPENLRFVGPTTKTLRNETTDDEELAAVARERAIQRSLFDGGFAGICVPVAYGGQGLTSVHQRAFNEEMAGYEYPTRMQSPTFSPCLAVLLDFGTEEQKLRHIPAILKGEEIWMQFLSEPSGGSDVAGALTSAVRDGDEWVLNGSKVWTTGAWWSDWGLCLARTNWDVAKHRGLSVFILPLRLPGIEVQRIEMLNGNREFCQEYLTDVRLPDSYRVGDVDDGWTVGTRWMFHERMLFNSPYVTIPAGSGHGASGSTSLLGVARQAGRADDPVARDLVGEARMLALVRSSMEGRLGEGMKSGGLSDQASAIGRLFSGVVTARLASIVFDVAGSLGGTWTDDDGGVSNSGTDFLLRQASCIGGGTTEMARNVISERVLGMPRELSSDRNVAFSDVPRGPSSRR